MKRLWEWADSRLQGSPDAVISLLLILTAVFGVGVALFGPRPLKLVLLGWWWFP